MRKAALVTCLLAAGALSACTATQAGQPTTGAAAPTSSTTPAFTDVSSMVVALKAQSGTTKTAHITIAMSTSSGDMNGEGNVRLSPSDLAEELTMTTPVGAMSMIMLPDAVYMKMPEGQQIAPGKPWLKIALDGNDQLSKTFGAIIKTAQSNSDITKSIEKLKDAGSITKSTKEQLDGADVTHYWITVDNAKVMAAQTDPTVKDLMQKAIDRGVKTSSNEIWLNKDNLPVKFFVESDLAAAGKTTMTVSYSNWGKPVNITPPPADQVGQLPKLGG